MAGFLIAGTPFFQTIYMYYAVDRPARGPASPASHANMTNQAILSWATNSITEIMTFGFGDYVPHLRSQQNRFTSEGWAGFVGAFDKMKLRRRLFGNGAARADDGSFGYGRYFIAGPEPATYL